MIDHKKRLKYDNRTITIEDIRKLDPCYDPVTGLNDKGNTLSYGFLPEGWSGTVKDILNVKDCPAQDRIWVAVRLINKNTRMLLATDWAEHVLHLYERKHDNKAPSECIEAIRQYAQGLINVDELRVAASAAYSTDAAYAYAAAYSTDAAAAYAAAAAAAAADARSAERKFQVDRFIDYLNDEAEIYFEGGI